MWPNPQETVDLVTFTEKSLMENFIFCTLWTVLVVLLSIEFFVMLNLERYLQKMPNILQYMLVQYWMELHLFTYQSKEFWKSQKISIVLKEYLVPWRFIKLLALLQQMVFVKWHFIIPQWNKHRFMSNGMRRMGTQILAATKNFHYRTTLWSYMCWVPWNLCSRSRLVGMFFHLRIHSLTYFYQF